VSIVQSQNCWPSWGCPWGVFTAWH